MDKLKLYLANPLGFSQLGTVALNLLIERLSEYFDVIESFTQTDPDISESLRKYADNPKVLAEINRDIGENNFKRIDESDLMLAILDGSDVDSGTAAEMGYACAKGKHVNGLRTDFRWSGDNLGDKINSQVMQCITKNGGYYLDSLDDMERWMLHVNFK